MLSLEELFCAVDDFCKIFEPLWHKQLLRDGHKHRQHNAQLSLSEMMTIQIAFHPTHYRNFKAFYLEIDQLKNISQIEHSRHRSPVNCLVNIVCGLIAYFHQPKKPSLNINDCFLPST
jgi:hypothetical protein